MDVVRRNIEGIRGKIEIDIAHGQRAVRKLLGNLAQRDERLPPLIAFREKRARVRGSGRRCI